MLVGADDVPVKNCLRTTSAPTPGPGVTSLLMISMPLTSGFSTWCTNVTSTEPSLVLVKDIMCATFWPYVLDRSMFDATVLPSIWTLKMRWFGFWVQVHRFARYSRTVTCVPAGTGKCHCISWPPVGSQRSLSKSASGARSVALLGIVASGVADGLYVATLDPVLRSALGSVWSAAQSGPSSCVASAGPAAFTR